MRAERCAMPIIGTSESRSVGGIRRRAMPRGFGLARQRSTGLRTGLARPALTMTLLRLYFAWERAKAGVVPAMTATSQKSIRCEGADRDRTDADGRAMEAGQASLSEGPI
jgi:hypothetical protein